MQVPAVCNVRSQSAGCPTSPAIDFLVPGLEGHHFVAWGVDGGIIDVGFFQVSHALDGSSASLSLPSSWRHLISLHIGTTDTDEAVTHLAFGGGPHVLLAAATRTKIAVFSLELLMDHVFQADTAAGVANEHESRPWELSPAVHDEIYLVGSINCFSCSGNNEEIISTSWTHQLDGVLVSDTAGGLTMWQLNPLGNNLNLSNNNFTSTFPEGADASTTALMTPTSATCASLRCAWKTTAPEPQDLLSAGVSIDAPSASAASKGEKNANVWWPENENLPLSSSTAASGSGSVRREKLKHSCNIMSLEWCPGVLRKDVFAADLGGGGAENNNLSSSSSSPEKMNTTGGTGNSTNSTIPPIEDHPALMTLGTDGAVRLWVEMLVVHHSPAVVQHSPSPLSSETTQQKQQQQVPAPTLDSYFAMALVVDSPSITTSRGEGRKNTSSSGGGVATPSSPPEKSSDGLESDRTSNGDSIIARWVRGSGSMMGRQRRGTTSSEVLWLVLATRIQGEEGDPHLEQHGGAIKEKGEDPDQYQYQYHHHGNYTSSWLIKLYAVRGLSAVVVANVPGSVAGVSSLSGGAGGGKRPQAVLWGQHLWKGATRSTSTVINNSSTGGGVVLPPPFLLSSFSAWMSAEDDFPMVTCFDIAACTARLPAQDSTISCVVDITAAGVTYATVLAENPTSPSTLHQRLDALFSWKAQTIGHSGTITSMAVCPTTIKTNITSPLTINTVTSSSGSGAGSSASGDRLVATVDINRNLVLWNAKNGIVEYLQTINSSSGLRPSCLEWIALPSSNSPQLPPPPSSAASVHVLVVGSGRQLLAFYPSNSSSSQLEIVGEVEGDVLSMYLFSTGRGGGSSSSGQSNQQRMLLLVLHTSVSNSNYSFSLSGGYSPTHVTLFEIASSNTVSAQIQPHLQQQQRLTLNRLWATAMALPSSLLGSITAVTPLILPSSKNNEGNSTSGGGTVSVLVGTSSGHVRTLVLPTTGSSNLHRIEDCVSNSINLGSTATSTSSSAVVAVAVDEESGTAAAILCNTSTTTSSTKSYLVLWKVVQPPSNSASPTTANTTATARPIKIPLEYPGASVAWLTGLIVPCVVVGDVYGNMTHFAPVRDAVVGSEGWKAVAKVDASSVYGHSFGFGEGSGGGHEEDGKKKAATTSAAAAAVCCLYGGSDGPLVAAIGSRIVCASDEVVIDDELKPLSRHLVEIAGPLPQYHPQMLQALLLGGHRDAACAVLRALTTWAPQYLQYQEQQRYYRLYRTTSDMMGGSGGTGGDSGSTAVLDAPTPRAAAELDAAGPPPFPAISLDQFLKPGLVDIPAKLVDMVEKTKGITTTTAAAAGQEERSSGLKTVTTQLSNLGIATAMSSSTSAAAATTASNVDMMASGQLDMSAFMGGDFGGGGGSIMSAPPPFPSAPPASAPSAMDTGMLDLAAFGMDMMPPPQPQPSASSIAVSPAAVETSIETGALDLSSFGMAFDIPAPASSIQPPPVTFTTTATSTAPAPAAVTAGGGAVLAAPKQAAVTTSKLRPFSSELLTSLHQIVGLVAAHEESGLDQEESSEYSNHRDLSFLRGASSRPTTSTGSTTTTAALDLLRSRPLQPLPGLTLEETQDVVAIATYFSSEGVIASAPFASSIVTTPVDEAGAHFLTALNVACSRPFEDPSNMPLTHDYDHNTTTSARVAPGSALAASPSVGKSLHKTPGSASTAALLRRSKSVRNAAGVEYTLAPSMSSMASLNSGEDDDEDGETFEGSASTGAIDVLARRWGLAPGLQPSALLWAQLTSSPQALLDHALAKIATRDAEIVASLQAEAVAQDASAADFLSNLGKPGAGSGSFSSGSGLTWPALRALGAGFWLQDRTVLASTAEALAKARFAVKRNPDDAALFYAALGKKSVLQGLYRTTNQTRQADFLGRDFSQVKNQQAACKNAFVLMGNHRPELAAAFFILGASPGDAVSVCVRELGDVQLALFIARLLHGPGSDAERALIERHIVPAVLSAAGDGDGAPGQGGGDDRGLSASGFSSSSLGGWASAVTAWLLGDSSACLKSILGLPALGPSSELKAAPRKDGPAGLVQLLPALELAAQIPPNRSSSELPSAESLKYALLERCATASEALQSAGLPALALQFEAVAAACNQRESGSSGNSIVVATQQGLRAAWACAAALLSHPSGTTQPAATEKQLAALRAVGLDIDKLEVLKRIHTLQKAINPTSASSSAAGVAGGSGLGSLFSPRAAAFGGSGGPSSLLFRQNSLDTIRSTHSMHSSGSGGPRLSIDGSSGIPRHGKHARSGGNVSAGVQNHQKLPPLAEGSIIFQVDSDSLHGVACCPLISPQVLGRPIITATRRHGLLEFAAQAPPPPPPLLQRNSSITLDPVPDYDTLYHHHNQSGSSSSAQQFLHNDLLVDANNDLVSEGSLPVSPHSPNTSNEQSANTGMFSRFLSQIFDQSSWTLDPMERTHSAIDGDVGLAVASAMASASSGHISPPAHHLAGSPATNASPSSPSERYSFSTSINPQITRALALAAHSSRQLFLSGCETSGRVQLWQFGGPRPVASFTPVSPNDLSATQADTGLFSFSFSTRSMSKTHSLVGRLGHWGGARGLAFSPNGERFAAVGDGGVVATWRLGGGAHRPTDVDGALCAEWWHHCLSKEGRAIVYIGGGSSVVCVGGKCSSGNIALWDAASPPSEACIGRLKHHSATVNALCTMPGGWLVAAADTGGALSLTDIRMLGGSSGGARTLWSVRASKGAVQSLVMLPLAATDRPRALAMGAASGGSGVLVSGGQDGMIRVWQASSGKLLQSLEGCGVQATQKGGGKGILSLGGGGSSSTTPSGVTGLAVCEEGLVSCGADGTVRLFPLAVY